MESGQLTRPGVAKTSNKTLGTPVGNGCRIVIMISLKRMHMGFALIVDVEYLNESMR